MTVVEHLIMPHVHGACACGAYVDGTGHAFTVRKGSGDPLSLPPVEMSGFGCQDCCPACRAGHVAALPPTRTIHPRREGGKF